MARKLLKMLAENILEVAVTGFERGKPRLPYEGQLKAPNWTALNWTKIPSPRTSAAGTH
jgi:hypothetical protein